jgi:hypothetical protein
MQSLNGGFCLHQSCVSSLARPSYAQDGTRWDSSTTLRLFLASLSKRLLSNRWLFADGFCSIILQDNTDFARIIDRV